MNIRIRASATSDGQIKTSAQKRYVGDNVYSANAAKESDTAKQKRGTTVTFDIKEQNDIIARKAIHYAQRGRGIIGVDIAGPRHPDFRYADYEAVEYAAVRVSSSA